MVESTPPRSTIGTGAAAAITPPSTGGLVGSTPGARPSAEAVGRPDREHIPPAPAPGALNTVSFPQDAAGIAALFARLPATIAGLPRLPNEPDAAPVRFVAGYGEHPDGLPGPRLVVQAVEIPNSGFFPANWDASDVIAAQSARGVLSADAPLPCGDRLAEATPSGTRRVAAGQEGALFWLREESFVGRADSPVRAPLCTIQWGMEASPYLYGVSADSQERLDAALAAIVAAAPMATNQWRASDARGAATGLFRSYTPHDRCTRAKGIPMMTLVSGAPPPGRHR